MTRKVWLLALMGLLSLYRISAAHAQTQQEMDAEYSQKYQKIDNDLKQLYQDLIAAHAHNPLFIKKLKESQRAWIAFRDAQIEALWPESDKQTNYGSIWPVCQSKALAELTLTRTDQLKRMLHGEEGDVCGWEIPR
jgi:uncharacterized protein YecT (DUF1311 family)